jgi:hypothetical protein
MSRPWATYESVDVFVHATGDMESRAACIGTFAPEKRQSTGHAYDRHKRVPEQPSSAEDSLLALVIPQERRVFVRSRPNRMRDR